MSDTCISPQWRYMSVCLRVYLAVSVTQCPKSWSHYLVPKSSEILMLNFGLKLFGPASYSEKPNPKIWF